MRSTRALELGAATLLSIAAVATSWSGYQATLWNGVQARAFGEANARRACAARAFDRAGRLRMIDLTLFLQWINAYSVADQRALAFYERRFPPSLRGAFDAWLKTSPARNSAAPPSPFAMPEYRLPEDSVVKRCDREALAATIKSQDANDTGDRYMLGTVIFAVVMFFASAVRDSRMRAVQLAMFTAAVVTGTAAIVFVARLPIATE